MSTNIVKNAAVRALTLGAVFCLLIVSSGVSAHAVSNSTSTGPCSYDDYGNTTNDAIYSNVFDAHQGSNVGVYITSITNYKVPNSGGGGYTMYSDIRVSVSKTFNKQEANVADGRSVCDASSSGKFSVTTVLWAAYNNVSQGGQLQNTQGEALSIASPSSDAQVFQSINGPPPTNIPGECCQVSDTSTSHEYVYTRVIDQSNVNLGCKIVDIHFYRVWSGVENKYKLWANIVIDSSQTYTATIPGNAVGVSTHTYSASQMRWLIVLPTGKHQLNTRAESFGGMDYGFPVIRQYVYE